MSKPSKPEKRWRRLRIALQLAAFLCVAAVLLSIPTLVKRSRISAQVDALIDSIKATGSPVVAADLRSMAPSLSENENAARLYNRAFAAMTDMNYDLDTWFIGDDSILMESKGPIPSDVLNEIRTFLDANHEAIQLLHEASTMPECLFAVNYEEGQRALLPHLPAIKKATRLLALDAVIHAREDRPDQAARSIESGITMANRISKEPMLISQLVRLSAYGLAFRGLQGALHHPGFKESHLASLAKVIQDAEDPEALTLALVGERTIYWDAMSTSREKLNDLLDINSDSSAPFTTLSVWFYDVSGRLARDQLFLLTALRECESVAHLPATERHVALSELEQRFTPLRTYDPDNLGELNVCSSMLLPSIGKAALADTRMTALVRLAGVTVAIERHRIATDREPPANISELSPQFLKSIPIDPYTGETIGYRTTDGGYVVYSVGADLKDEAGHDAVDEVGIGPNPFGGDDLAFIVE